MSIKPVSLVPVSGGLSIKNQQQEHLLAMVTTLAINFLSDLKPVGSEFSVKVDDGAVPILKVLNILLGQRNDDVRALWNRGLIYLAQGHVGKARQDLDKAITLDPNSVEAYSARGVFHLHQLENEEALADFDRALEIDQKCFLALSHRFIIQERLGNRKEALQGLEAVQKHPQFDAADFIKMLGGIAEPHVFISSLQGAISFKVGNIQDTYQYISSVYDKANGDPLVFEYAGKTYFKLGRFLSAEQEFYKVLEKDPENIESLIYLAKTDLLKGKYKEVVKRLKKVAAKSPELRSLRGEAYRLWNKRKKAIAEFTRSIQEQPNVFAYSRRGAAYQAKGDYEAASQDFEAALKLDPDDLFSINQREKVIQLKNKEEFLQTLSKAQDFERSRLEFEMLILKGKYKAASKRVQEISQKSGKYAKLVGDTTYMLKRAWLHMIQGKNLESMMALQLIPDQYKEHTYVDLIEAVTLVNHGHYRRALEKIEFVLKNDPDDCLALSVRAECYRRLGEKEQAFVDFSRAVEIEPANLYAAEQLYSLFPITP